MMRNSYYSLSALILFIGTAAIPAMEPPTPEQIKKYKEDCTVEQRIAAAKALGNHNTSPNLIWDAKNRLYKLVTGKDSPGLLTLPPCRHPGLAASGNQKMLVLLIAFSDMSPVSGDTQAIIHSKLFGDGTAGPPHDSLRNYYLRSSYSQLTLSGNTLGWYTTAYPRSNIPETVSGRENLIKEVLNYYNVQGHDFTQYDNDGDGTIDYFAVIWAGPPQDWGDFWWGYNTGFSDSSYTVDGKTLYTYSWQWESASYPTGLFGPKVLTHETGHALGLSDYYDYDDEVGPIGGVGGLDMMDSDYGDHNCFSKFLLNWITPTVCSTGGTHTVTLNPSESSQDAMIVMPTAIEENTFDEYFMIQARNQTQNDVGYPNSGLLVWHVDARLDAEECLFQYNNSYTAHKLLRLMEADGLEEIEQNYSADAGDYYFQGRSFGDNTVPNSKAYDGSSTSVAVLDILPYAEPVTFDLNCDTVTCTPPGAPTLTAATGGCTGVNLTWTPGTGRTSAYHVYRSTNTVCPAGGRMQRLNASAIPSGTLSYNDTTAARGTTYTYMVRGACDTGGGGVSASSNCLAGTRPELPVVITGVTATAGCAGNTITWFDSHTATSYNVMRGATCGTTAVSFTGVTSPFIDTTAVLGTNYNYWVAGVNSCGTGPDSSCAPVTSGGPPQAPTEVLAWEHCTHNSVAWTNSPGAASHNVLRGTICGTAITTFTNVTSEFSDTTAEPGVTYNYWVVGVNACGPGINSSCATTARTVVPPAPTNVSATPGCTGNSISWTNSPTALYHKVLRGTACGTTLTTFSNVTAPYNDTTAATGTTYNYWVVGVNGCGAGPISSCAAAARLTIPTAPTGVTATAGCTGNSVAWTNSPAATSHNVLRGTTCGTVITTFTNVTTPYNDTSAVAGTTYNYWVAGVNSCGTGSDSACAASARLTIPAAPAGVTATASCSGNLIAWTNSPTGTSHNVLRGTTCGTALTTFTNATSPYNDTTAVPGTTYNYWVVGVNSCGAGSDSSCAAAARLSIPAAPAGVTATAGCSGNLIAWTDSPTADSHNVLRGTACGTAITTFTNMTSPFNDTAAVIGTTYSYWVVGINSCGTGPNSSCAVAARLTIPAAPAGVTATAGCSGNLVAWTNSPTAASHNVLRGTLCGTAATTFTNVTTPYNDTTAAAGATYNYWVVGVNACGTSANSSCAAATRVSVPSAPSAPSFNGVHDTSLTVDWAAVPGAASYDVWRVSAASCTGVVKITGTPVQKLSYFDTGLTCGTLYNYRITANNSCGTSAPGLCGQTVTAICTGVPPEVAPGTTFSQAQAWQDTTTQTWPSEASATGYILYRGVMADLPFLLDEAEDGCERYSGSATIISTLTEEPSGVSGRFYWYIVTGVNANGEGSAGNMTDLERTVDAIGNCL
jgi:M6 family metalloprotease-like protein